MHSNPIIVKYGGAAMNDAAAARALMAQIVALQQSGQPIVLVHGGGPEIDRMLARVGITPQKERGLRITDDATMEIVEMVLAGKVSKGLVSLLQAAGGRAVGLSGRDGGIVSARKKNVPGIDLGRVGDVSGVNTDLITTLLAAGYIPVLCSVSEDDEGNTLNINADEVAGAVAVALEAAALVLLTDVPGVLRDYPKVESLIERMSCLEARKLIDSGVIDKGMIPKIQGCVEALMAGVDRAYILDGRNPENLQTALSGSKVTGTVIVSDAVS